MRIDTTDLGSSFRSLPHQASADVDSQTEFAAIMGVQNRVRHAGAGDAAENAKKVAEEFVAKVFLEPMLKQVRESNQTPPPFGPGPGEKQFASMMDAQRALDLVRSASWPIVDRLAADMTRNQTASERAVPEPEPRSVPTGTPI